MINLTHAECSEHGRTLFGKRPRRRVMTCMICDRPASAYEAEIHIRRCTARAHKTNAPGASVFGAGAAVVVPASVLGND